jgi:hypothetical protein
MSKETQLIRDLVGNRIFSAEFIKKDGTLRKIVARLDVKKHLKGGELKYSPEKLNYLVVFDLQEQGYRTININQLKSITVDGVRYDV